MAQSLYYLLWIHEKQDRKSTRLNSSHANISYAVFCLKKKQTLLHAHAQQRHRRPTRRPDLLPDKIADASTPPPPFARGYVTPHLRKLSQPLPRPASPP